MPPVVVHQLQQHDHVPTYNTFKQLLPSTSTHSSDDALLTSTFSSADHLMRPKLTRTADDDAEN